MISLKTKLLLEADPRVIDFHEWGRGDSIYIDIPYACISPTQNPKIHLEPEHYLQGAIISNAIFRNVNSYLMDLPLCFCQVCREKTVKLCLHRPTVESPFISKNKMDTRWLIFLDYYQGKLLERIA